MLDSNMYIYKRNRKEALNKDYITEWTKRQKQRTHTLLWTANLFRSDVESEYMISVQTIEIGLKCISNKLSLGSEKSVDGYCVSNGYMVGSWVDEWPRHPYSAWLNGF